MPVHPTCDFGCFSGLTPSAGIIEAVSMGIADFFLRESQEDATWFARSALAESSTHRVLRVHTALASVMDMPGPSKTGWAREMLPNVHARMHQLLAQQYGQDTIRP